MRAKIYFLIIIFPLSILYSISSNANEDNNYTPKFKQAMFQSCDTVFHTLENGCSNMMCQDILVNAWAECWRKSMNFKLNQRLLKLKSSDPIEFHLEMGIQKSFNSATEKLCGKNCGEERMRGISYNYCRVDAYKYRTAQAIQMNLNQLFIPTEGNLLPNKSRKEKVKDTKYYESFSEQLCKLPTIVWKGENPPTDCQKKVFMDLNSFEFTDNVCDLS